MLHPITFQVQIFFLTNFTSSPYFSVCMTYVLSMDRLHVFQCPELQNILARVSITFACTSTLHSRQQNSSTCSFINWFSFLNSRSYGYFSSSKICWLVQLNSPVRLYGQIKLASRMRSVHTLPNLYLLLNKYNYVEVLICSIAWWS